MLGPGAMGQSWRRGGAMPLRRLKKAAKTFSSNREQSSKAFNGSPPRQPPLCSTSIPRGTLREESRSSGLLSCGLAYLRRGEKVEGKGGAGRKKEREMCLESEGKKTEKSNSLLRFFSSLSLSRSLARH